MTNDEVKEIERLKKDLLEKLNMARVSLNTFKSYLADYIIARKDIVDDELDEFASITSRDILNDAKAEITSEYGGLELLSHLNDNEQKTKDLLEEHLQVITERINFVDKILK